MAKRAGRFRILPVLLFLALAGVFFLLLMQIGSALLSALALPLGSGLSVTVWQKGRIDLDLSEAVRLAVAMTASLAGIAIGGYLVLGAFVTSAYQKTGLLAAFRNVVAQMGQVFFSSVPSILTLIIFLLGAFLLIFAGLFLANWLFSARPGL